MPPRGRLERREVDAPLMAAETEAAHARVR